MNSYSPDDADVVTSEFLIQNPRRFRPHVVILGAGASKQALYNGDKHGRMLPVMNDLIDTVGLKNELAEIGVQEPVSNFEMIYSSLHADFEKRPQLAKIEEKIHRYFSKLELPDEPTLYDHLLLSLRRHDLVATFNWDPLLFGAWLRLRHRFGQEILPSIAHLHGNVGIGYCQDHVMFGQNGLPCDKCNRILEPTPLFYPIAEKEYDENRFIKNSWDMLKAGLEHAFTITVFGYSAPTSDKAAKDSMLKAWKATSGRQFETMFFIDLKTYEEVADSWRSFFFEESPHFRIYRDFYDSPLARYARRSVEAIYVPTIEGKWAEPIPIPRDATWDELKIWLDKMQRFEK